MKYRFLSSVAFHGVHILFKNGPLAFLMLLVVFRKPENSVTQKCSVTGLNSFSLLNNSPFSLIQHNFSNRSCHVQIAGGREPLGR